MSNPQAFPEQPDGIASDSRDLPDVNRAIARVRAYVAASGDGLYEVYDGAPLYGRDLEALCRAAKQFAIVEVAPVYEPVAWPSGEALYVHLPCKQVELWHEESQGPINEQGCDACEGAPDGQWRPVYVRRGAGGTRG